LVRLLTCFPLFPSRFPASVRTDATVPTIGRHTIALEKVTTDPCLSLSLACADMN